MKVALMLYCNKCSAVKTKRCLNNSTFRKCDNWSQKHNSYWVLIESHDIMSRMTHNQIWVCHALWQMEMQKKKSSVKEKKNAQVWKPPHCSNRETTAPGFGDMQIYLYSRSPHLNLPPREQEHQLLSFSICTSVFASPTVNPSNSEKRICAPISPKRRGWNTSHAHPTTSSTWT